MPWNLNASRIDFDDGSSLRLRLEGSPWVCTFHGARIVFAAHVTVLTLGVRAISPYGLGHWVRVGHTCMASTSWRAHWRRRASRWWPRWTAAADRSRSTRTSRLTSWDGSHCAAATVRRRAGDLGEPPPVASHWRCAFSAGRGRAGGLGYVAVMEGDRTQAAPAQASAGRSASGSDPGQRCYTLEGYAILATAANRPEQAVRLAVPRPRCALRCTIRSRPRSMPCTARLPVARHVRARRGKRACRFPRHILMKW